METVLRGERGDWWALHYPPDNMQRPTGPTCDGCHSVGYDIHTKQVAEWNVGCERCHGPGSEHVTRRSRDSIVNPAHMDDVAANDTCIQCHSQGRPLTIPLEGKYYDWPVGYRVGLRLATIGSSRIGSSARRTSRTSRTARPTRIGCRATISSQSLMYRRGITCSTATTSTARPITRSSSSRPIRCAWTATALRRRTARMRRRIEEHTHHKADSPGSQCVACHMPKIETDDRRVRVHAHTFEFITPAMTDKYKIPNPCTSCHADKSTAWATRRDGVIGRSSSAVATRVTGPCDGRGPAGRTFSKAAHSAR